MLRLAARSLLVLAVVLGEMQVTHAEQYLVVSRAPADGAWSFQEFHSIAVNGKDKLRTAPAVAASTPALPAPSWDSKAIGRLAEVHLSSFAVVRRTPAGELLGRTSGSTGWQSILPEGTNAKVPVNAAAIWQASGITARKDQKDKTPVAVSFDQLYAIVPGADAGASAAMMATDLSAHTTPGVSQPDAFRTMLSLLPAAVKAFPAEPAAKTVHDFLEATLSGRLKMWQTGDVEVSVLDQALAYANAAETAFPNDPALGNLSKLARSVRAALDRRVAILRALNAGKRSDAFLAAYREFEIYDKSFPELAEARAAHMKASAAEHVQTAQSLQGADDYLGAIRNLLIAKWRDPKSKAADDLLEQVRLEAARLSAQRFAETRRGIDPRSPAQVQLQRKLFLAEQQMNDGKIAEAEKTLQEADAMDKDEPRLTLLEARLSVARGDLGKALAYLDNFDGIAVTAQDFSEGERLRASVHYTINNSLEKKRTRVESDLDQQLFASALEASTEGLKLDNENPDFLYYSALNACVLRHCDQAEPLLRRYLDLTDSAQANRQRRLSAMQLLGESIRGAMVEADAKSAADGGNGGKAWSSWFSDAPLGAGVFYDPVSLAFQPKISRIAASDHLNILYEWNGEQLRSVHAKHEEKQTGGNIARLTGAAVASAAGMPNTLIWKTAQRETNDFYFNYAEGASPQILKVSRENTVVQSRSIPISIPGVGIAGPFAGVGALSAVGSLGALGRMGAGGLSGLGGMGGMTGFGGMGGAGNSALLSRLAGSGRMSGISGFASLGSARQLAPQQKYSVTSDPQGGASAGFLTLWNSPRLDPRLAFKVTGKRAAVGFSGNHFFDPFVWDGIHLFEFDYDGQGRVVHAWELDEPSAPRLDFSWDGQRLKQVTAYDSSEPPALVYRRVLNYSADRLVSEVITSGTTTSHISYKYDKQGRLLEAGAEADRSLDGRSRKIYFVEEDKGRR